MTRRGHKRGAWIPVALALVVLVSGSYAALAPVSIGGRSSPEGAAASAIDTGQTSAAGPAPPSAAGPATGLVKYALPGQPQRVAYDPASGEAFVSAYDQLEVLNTSNGSLAASISTGGASPLHSADYPVVYDPSDGLVYEGLYANSTIEYVYPGNLTHGTIPIYGGDYAEQLLYDPVAGEVLIFGPAGHGFWTLNGLSAINRTSQWGTSTNATLGDLYGAYFSANGIVYVASTNAAPGTGHPVWGLNAATLALSSYIVVRLTWAWNAFVVGTGSVAGVSAEGYFSAVNLSSGLIQKNWTWSASSIGSPYYSLAFSPPSDTFALASKHNEVRLFSLKNGTGWEADVTGPVPQVAYLSGPINLFAASTWSPTTLAPGLALFLISPTGLVHTTVTGMDTFSITTFGDTVWVGGSQYGYYPDADAIESYTLSTGLIPSGALHFGQTGGNASGSDLAWSNPAGTVNVTLLAGTALNLIFGLVDCNVTSRISLGNVSTAFVTGFRCAAVETWNVTGPTQESPFIEITQLLPDMTYYRLPAWNNLTSYAWDDACGGHCNGVGSNQQPLMSWTSDGVYYVNETDQLVYYSFSSHAVTKHWPWVPLYQQIMNYAGIENTEWITPNGEWVYTFGSLSGGAPEAITFYAVNISSGRTVEYNFTGISLNGSESSNIQVNIIGIDGEYNTVALLWGYSFILYSLVNGKQWDSGQILTSGVEANNIYWVPELNSMVEVYADGADPSGWDQLTWNGSGFESVSSGSIPVLSNGVQGLYFNLTSHRLYTDVQANPTAQYTFYWTINGTVLSSSVHLVSKTIEITAPVHRMMESAGGEAIGGTNYYMMARNAENWATAFLPNGSVVAASPYAMQGAWNWTPQALEGLGYDASYQLYPLLTDCYPVECALGGANTSWVGSGNVALVGSTPFPANAPLVLGPPAPPNATVQLTAHDAIVTWSEPAASEALNFTVWWGQRGRPFTHSESLLPTNDSFTVAGLNSSTQYEFEVVAHNLDWYGEGSVAGQTLATYPVTFTESGLPAKTSWSVDWNGTILTSTNATLVVNATNGTYTWQVPSVGGALAAPSSGNVTVAGSAMRFAVAFAPWSPSGASEGVASSVVGPNYAIFQWKAITGADNYSISDGATCSTFGASLSLGNVLQDNLSGLTPGTAYCVEVHAWNGSSAVIVTDDTEIFTGSPTITSVDASTVDVTVSWANPSGEPTVVLDAVYLYSADGAYMGSSGTGGPATSITLAGLEYSTTYSVRIRVDYSGGGSSMLSAPATFTTPGCTQDCAASAQPGLMGWLLIPTNAAILAGFALSAVSGAAVVTFLRTPRRKRR